MMDRLTELARLHNQLLKLPTEFHKPLDLFSPGFVGSVGAAAFDDTALKAYWKFNETSGDVINQSQSAADLGSAADLQITGATFNNSNTPFNTMNFDGVNDKAIAGTSLSQWNFMHDGGKWTVAMWIELGDITEEGLLFSNINGSNVNGVNILQNTSSQFNFRVFDSGLWLNQNMGNHGLTNGNPFFLTFTFDPTEATDKATFYRDAVEISAANQSTSQGTPANSNVAMNIAHQDGGTSFLTMNTAEMSVWNRILSDTEISDLYNSGNGLEIY